MRGRHSTSNPNKTVLTTISGIAVAAVGVVVAFAVDTFWGTMISLVGVALAGAAWRVRIELRNRAPDNTHGPSSLIHQRMRLNRSRNTGLQYLAASALFPVLELVMVSIDPSRPLRSAALFPSVMFFTIGITQLVMATLGRRRFENEFGKSARKQQAIEH